MTKMFIVSILVALLHFGQGQCLS